MIGLEYLLAALNVFAYGPAEYICMMLGRGLEFRSLDWLGRLPLQVVVEEKYTAAVRKLFELGLDATQPGLLHMLALRYAPQSDGDEELIRLLVDHGADVNEEVDIRQVRSGAIPVGSELAPGPATALDVAMWKMGGTAPTAAMAKLSRIVRVLRELGAKNSAGFGTAAEALSAVSSKEAEREWGQRQCEGGNHTWVAEGIRTYYSSGGAYKSEISGYVCKHCRRPKPR